MIPIKSAEDMMEFLGYFKATDENFYRKAYEGPAPEMERWGVPIIELDRRSMDEHETIVFSRTIKNTERLLAPVRLEFEGIVGGMFLTTDRDLATLYVNGSDHQWTVIDLTRGNSHHAKLSGLFVGSWDDALTSFLSDSPRVLEVSYATLMSERTELDLRRRSTVLAEATVEELGRLRKNHMLRVEAAKEKHNNVFKILHTARETKAILAIQDSPDYDADKMDSDSTDFPLSYYLVNHAEPLGCPQRSFDRLRSLANQRMSRMDSDTLGKSAFTIWRTVKNETVRYAEYDKHNGIWNLV